MNQSTGKIIIFIGILIVLIGVIYYFFGNKLSFLGRLPGDIRIEKENFKFYFPITTCILISILVTVLIKLVQWLSR